MARTRSARSAGGMPIKCGVKERYRDIPTKKELQEWNGKLNKQIEHGHYRSVAGRRRSLMLSQIDSMLGDKAEDVDLLDLTEIATKLEGLSPLGETQKRSERLPHLANTLLAVALLAKWDGVSLRVVGERAFDSLQN